MLSSYFQNRSKSLVFVRGDILTYKAAMARKPIKNKDLLWPVRRVAFSGFIGKRVNIYVTSFS
jgi:hypothetical protein